VLRAARARQTTQRADACSDPVVAKQAAFFKGKAFRVRHLI